ncbi:hypothetical protein NOVA_21865 [Nocardia nova]|uniref:hypothetical protein n=1 Tax=Nocardia nova TaxID=37330 RepID=UPI001C47FB9B|nr:hypothetical protein [Nocardia nova]MBV7705431.1 hypothetical protein [Nocardia nova]
MTIVKALIILNAALIATIVALAAYMLSRCEGSRRPTAAAHAGATFAAALTLLILVINTLGLP